MQQPDVYPAFFVRKALPECIRGVAQEQREAYSGL